MEEQVKIKIVFKIFRDVLKERHRQNEKWGWPRNHFDSTWYTIFMEEVGEIAEALLDGTVEEARREIIQAIAVLFAWLESKFYNEEK